MNTDWARAVEKYDKANWHLDPRWKGRSEGTPCADCGTPQIAGNDSTTLNFHGVCRICVSAKSVPMPWRVPKGIGQGYNYGCYFPSSDLNVSEGGNRGTGKPQNVEWIK